MATNAYVWTGNEGEPEMSVLDNLIDDDNMTVEQAVQRTIDLARTPRTFPNPLAIHCECTARGAIVAAARTAPERHSKLIDYVHELRNRTVTDIETGQPLLHDGQELWKDLPTFEYIVSDELHSIPAPRHTTEKLAEWENIIAFFAQLDASTTDPKLDFIGTWALKYIWLALVSPLEKYPYESTLRMACSWFVYDAEKLWRKVPDEEDFSLTNWQRWKRALEEKRVKAEGKTLEMIEEALGEIERVEKS